MNLTDISHKDLLDDNADKRDAVLSPKEQRDAVVLPKDHPLYKHVSHAGVQKVRSQITAPTIINGNSNGNSWEYERVMSGNMYKKPFRWWLSVQSQ